MSKEDVENIANSEVRKIMDIANGYDAVVHLMGEQTLSFSLIMKLKGKGIRCVASTTERETWDSGGNKRVVAFEFVRFREY